MESLIYTNRGLCDCVANSLMRAVLNTAMEDARLLQRMESVHLYDRLPFSLILPT